MAHESHRLPLRTYLMTYHWSFARASETAEVRATTVPNACEELLELVKTLHAKADKHLVIIDVRETV